MAALIRKMSVFSGLSKSRKAKAVGQPSVKFTERLKTGVIGRFWERSVKYTKMLLSDYKAVAVDTVTDCKERPFKATFYISSAIFLGYAFYKNPDEESFNSQVVDATNDLLLVSNMTRNPEADQHMQNIIKWGNEGILRRWNLVFFSIMWRDNYTKECALYDARCKYLQPRWKGFEERIVDIGFLGWWYYLNEKMVDYDVNPNEFQDESK
ncbi:mitochondrial import inner membrane translocase subunit Tim29-like [Saccoglossus kowalevskii]|uniref:Uncharacterized protein C19orf52 homolog n=1 Tax=Saccoglossus kowalevskii TaxID=10224 RepID=A0ABM0GM43_SACKO|nr:PREDICTED: uncharacterized protein C19orf52 homolog [Saccoglossus kowalevskii]